MKKLTFYDFMFSREPERHKFVALRNVINSIPKFPKANSDRKTVETSMRKHMGDAFDEYLFNQAWACYEQEKLFMELCDI